MKLPFEKTEIKAASITISLVLLFVDCRRASGKGVRRWNLRQRRDSHNQNQSKKVGELYTIESSILDWGEGLLSIELEDTL